jgi:ribosomal-protein-alanine N-acetyltransferase
MQNKHISEQHFPLSINFEGVSLRPVQLSDSSILPKYANNIKIAQNMRDVYPFPYSEKDAEDYLARVCGSTPVTHFLIFKEQEHIGNFAFLLKEDVHRYNAEIGYWLGEPFWGRGIMPGVIRTMLLYIFNNFEISRVYAEVFSPNTGSMKVLEKSGFKKEAVIRKNVFKNGQFLDTHLYSMLNDEFRQK